MLSSLAVWADDNTNNNNNYNMRNFFFNTYVGVGLIMVAVAIMTLLVDTTLCIILFGGGRSILTTLATEGIIPVQVIEICDYIWGAIILTFYLCTLYPLFVYFVSCIKGDVETTITITTTTDEEQD